MTAPAQIETVLEGERLDLGVRRERKRPQPIPLKEIERQEVVDRVIRLLEECDQSRSQEKAMRVQRYAKLMQYQGEQDEPFEGASNVQLPDIMSAVLRTEDTLQNAAMSTRPMVQSKAVSAEHRDRERKTDLMLDHQFFSEQDGEALVEHASMNFVRDGFFVALTQWVRELRKVLYTRSFSAIPNGVAPQTHFRALLDRVFSPASWRELEDSEGWDWQVSQGKQELLVRFYTEDDGDVTMQVEGLVETFAGPRPLIYDYEDVLAPAWSLNLQPPGPSNPCGAPFVMLVDYPVLDEIMRGVESGFYDLVTLKDLEEVEGWADWRSSDREIDRQRREIRGQDATDASKPEVKEHEQIKRVLCFDLWGGLDVVWTVLVGGANYLLRARPLTEVCPGIPPRRPLAHAAMIPVQGTWIGMGLPELMESMHDHMTSWFNATSDSATFELYPWFVYRLASNLKNEEVRFVPGHGIGVNDIQRDLKVERVPAQAGAVGVNMIALGNNEQEKLISMGDLQLGRIPAGKSSALRTSSGIQQVLAQGEARPERILRRFFKGIIEIHRTMYQLNRHFLPEKKKFRVVGIAQPNEDPFIEVSKSDDLVDFLFDFQASVLNSSKIALQQGLEQVIAMSGTPLMFQLGISTPETFYRAVTDYYRALGQNAESYAKEPTPGAKHEPILAEEALSQIMAGQLPQGPPAEGDFQAHQQRLAELLSATDEMGQPRIALLSVDERQRLGLYLQQLQAQALAAQQQAELLAAAQQFQAGQQQKPEEGGGGQGKPAQPTLVERNDVVNESLPSSGTPQ